MRRLTAAFALLLLGFIMSVCAMVLALTNHDHLWMILYSVLAIVCIVMIWKVGDLVKAAPVKTPEPEGKECP